MLHDFQSHIGRDAEELITISSINSINLSLLHQFYLVLNVSAVSARELLQVPLLWGINFGGETFFFILCF